MGFDRTDRTLSKHSDDSRALCELEACVCGKEASHYNKGINWLNHPRDHCCSKSLGTVGRSGTTLDAGLGAAKVRIERKRREIVTGDDGHVDGHMTGNH